MREIKFRAWDKIRKEMMGTYDDYVVKFDGSIGLVNGNGNLEFNNEDGFLDDNYILMQFTGLYDKNGKEIYEGDIVKEYEFCGTIACVSTDVVRYDDKIACFVLGEERDIFLDLPDYEYEVIGNIYENPELVKNC